MQLVKVPDKRPEYTYACLFTRAGVESAESKITAHSLEEANGYATYKFGDFPVKCRSLAADGQLAQQRAQPAQSHPFAGLSMGDYFDAIYNGDRYEVRRQDKQGVAKITSALSSGYGNDPVWKKMMGLMGIDKSTLLVPVISTYTLNYDRIYAACLRSDAETFTRVSTTTRNGVVIDRQETGTYRVNREFAEAFKSAADPGSAMGAIADAAHGSPIGRIEESVRTMMGTRRCNDPAIKQFESQIIQMYSDFQAGRFN
jgi:hypothetical protein